MLYRFRRQRIVSGETIDFYCPKLTLALQVESARQDQRELTRLATLLTECGVTVLRLRAGDILGNLNEVKRVIARAVVALAREYQVAPSERDRCQGLSRSGLFCQADTSCTKVHSAWLFPVALESVADAAPNPSVASIRGGCGAAPLHGAGDRPNSPRRRAESCERPGSPP
jgi:hypothetical protein